MAPSRTNRPNGKPPRPPNPWILFRTERLRELVAEREREIEEAIANDQKPPPRLQQSGLSRTIAEEWQGMPKPAKKKWDKMAEIAKAKHAEKYPGYKYQPESRQDKLKRLEEEKRKKKQEQEAAKAAKALAKGGKRKASSKRSSSSAATPAATPAPTPPSSGESSAVKLENLEEPVLRGQGPSPPLDSGDETSVYSSGSSLLSDFEESGGPSSFAIGSVSVAAVDVHAPNPSYAPGFGPIDPSLMTLSDPSAQLCFPTAGSTPNDSPPSYTEGDYWQSLGASLGGGVNSWNATDGQYSMMGDQAQLPVQFNLSDVPSDAAGLSYDDFLAMMVQGTQMSYSPYLGAAPPDEINVDMAGLVPSAGALTNPGDFLAATMNMDEFHDTIEDTGFNVAAVSNQAQAVVDGVAPFSFEEVANFQVQYPGMAHAFVNQQQYYDNMAVQMSVELTHQAEPQVHQQPPYQSDPVIPTVSPSEISGPADSPYEIVQRFLESCADPSPMTPAPSELTFTPHIAPHHVPPAVPEFVPAPAFTPAPEFVHVPTPAPEFVHVHTPAPGPVPTPAPTEMMTPAPRYVPPSGARLPPRRRVGRHYPYPPNAETHSSYDTSGSA
ncbi:hypothetical protein C8Q79DRAFT_927704 [Trametes meyenii]|nr:hypothetical protein C8Q79DRAFT_927704 [Trametes meyenii]